MKLSPFLSRDQLVRRAIDVGGLASFVRMMWSYVVPDKLLWNWHHDIICKTLERVTVGEIKKLYIAQPPGTTKSLITSVMWPAWEWTIDPTTRYIVMTYGSSVTLKSARQHRDLVNSNFYLSQWPSAKIPYQNTHAAAWFENVSHGFRFSGTVGGDVTGRHATRLLGDDLNKGQDVYGSVDSVAHSFDRSWDMWDGVLTSRIANPNKTARVLIGQRLHRDDVGGRWLHSDPSVHVVCLPMRGDPNGQYRHPDDHRSEGELLWPEHWTEKAVCEMEKRPTEFAAQFQQNPLPSGGLLILEQYMSNRYDQLPNDIRRTQRECAVNVQGQEWITSWDMTFKGKSTSDLVVGQLWCAINGEYFLIDQIKKRAGFRDTKQMMRDFIGRYPWVRKHIIEDAANAAAIEDDMRNEIPGIILEPHGGGVLSRVQQCEGLWASGAVRLPQTAPWLGGSDGFIAEHLSFDGLGTRHDDQVSAASLALLHLSNKKQMRWIEAMRAANNS